jgi:PAS domain S-box-containing protein
MENPMNPNTLRAEAEAQLADGLVTKPVTRTTDELLHELRIYRSELKLQNEELQRAYAALEESHDCYVDLYDFAPVGYITLTHEGLIAELNLTAAELFGEVRHKLFYHQFVGFVSPNDGNRWNLFFTGIMKHKKRKKVELTLKGCNDTEFPVQLDCQCVNSMLRITLTDITQIKKAEEALRKAELAAIICTECKPMEQVLEDASNQLEKISSQLPGMAYQFRLRVDGSFCFPYASEAIRDIYRLGQEDVREDASKVFAIVHSDDYNGVIVVIHESARDLSPLSHEYRVKYNDGTVRWLLSNSLPQREKDGSTLWHGFTSDISERKNQEQKDAEHLNELAHVTRLGLIGEMASGIAHEVNQPLSAIANYSQVSLNMIKKENPDLVLLSEILSKTQQQALKAGKIIHRIKSFVKFHVKHRSSVDINASIQKAVDLCVAELRRYSIKLTLELEDNLPMIHVEQIHIEQVIINLIRNSFDALLDLPGMQRQITINSQLTANNEIQVSVKDNGLGINEDQQQKILTPFYTTKTEGAGMGLAISRSLIEAHGGALKFNSERGKGTTFYFTLPIVNQC